MSAPFKVGEVLILQNCFILENEGKECVITGGLAERFGHITGRALCYQIEKEGGVCGIALPHQLRRRPPSDSHERTYMQKWRDMAGKAPQRMGEPA